METVEMQAETAAAALLPPRVPFVLDPATISQLAVGSNQPTI